MTNSLTETALMRIAYFSLFTTCVLALIVLISGNAHACRLTRALTNEQINRTDIVFIGEAIEYIKTEKNLATITFKIKKVVKGNYPSETITVYWGGGTNYQISNSLKEFKKGSIYMALAPMVRVGLVLTETYRNSPHAIFDIPFSSTKALNYLDRPWIMGGICSLPFIYPVED